MTREDIEKAALDTLNSFDVEYIYHKDYASKESFCEGYMMGAEWMQEQYKHTDVHTDNTDVIAKLQAEVEKLKTEKAWMIEKMRQYLYTNWVGGNTYVFDLSEFIKSMWE